MRSLVRFLLPLALVGCASVAAPDPASLAQNPLYVYDEATLRLQHLTDIEIAGTGSGSLIEQRKAARRQSEDAQVVLQQGWSGVFVRVLDEMSGRVLLTPQAIYFSSDFLIPPGLNVHVYLTEAVDPRDVTFPDDTAVDLGRLVTPFGAQTMAVPSGLPIDGTLRTVVLYDEALQRTMGFAQLSTGA